MGLDIDEPMCLDNVGAIIGKAKGQSNFVRVDDLFWELELPCPDGAASDDSLPLYATRRDGRWVVLDGAERLVQAKKRGAETVRVAVIREYLLGAIAT